MRRRTDSVTAINRWEAPGNKKRAAPVRGSPLRKCHTGFGEGYLLGLVTAKIDFSVYCTGIASEIFGIIAQDVTHITIIYTGADGTARWSEISVGRVECAGIGLDMVHGGDVCPEVLHLADEEGGGAAFEPIIGNFLLQEALQEAEKQKFLCKANGTKLPAKILDFVFYFADGLF